MYTCIGSTALGTAYIVLAGYQYTTQIKPIQLEKTKIENEAILSEGRETMTN